jgi:hypothetical protein
MSYVTRANHTAGRLQPIIGHGPRSTFVAYYVIEDLRIAQLHACDLTRRKTVVKAWNKAPDCQIGDCSVLQQRDGFCCSLLYDAVGTAPAPSCSDDTNFSAYKALPHRQSTPD